MSGSPERVLLPGEFYEHERFGPETVNRGAVLWECEWDGGIFESGVFLGGIFHAGVFRGGVVWAALWRGGAWKGGLWHHGFGPDGAYRPRGAFPGRDAPAVEAAEAPIDARSSARATVFAASVYGDIPRLWHASLTRALPEQDVTFELFDDSPEGALEGGFLPGVALLRRSAERPDFQVAYADALWRATTPLLAFVDTDVYWLSRDIWFRILRELEKPEVAAVACLGRADSESPGTFAVVLRTATCREVVRNVPGRFTPSVESANGRAVPGRLRGHDTGDLVARAVVEAGYRLPTLTLEDGDFVRFDAITMTRLLGSWVGEDALATMAATNRYFRRGCLGAFALARVHDEVFPEGPPFGRPLRAGVLWRRLLGRPRTLLAALRDAAEFRKGAAHLRRALAPGHRAARTSS